MSSFTTAPEAIASEEVPVSFFWDAWYGAGAVCAGNCSDYALWAITDVLYNNCLKKQQ